MCAWDSNPRRLPKTVHSIYSYLYSFLLCLFFWGGGQQPTQNFVIAIVVFSTLSYMFVCLHCLLLSPTALLTSSQFLGHMLYVPIGSHRAHGIWCRPKMDKVALLKCLLFAKVNKHSMLFLPNVHQTSGARCPLVISKLSVLPHFISFKSLDLSLWLYLN